MAADTEAKPSSRNFHSTYEEKKTVHQGGFLARFSSTYHPFLTQKHRKRPYLLGPERVVGQEYVV
uniref:Uncharacterized protein n=1 Tax=Aegilops tauschii subsp. strangulata TaxID=200361 RepID=A0A452XID8_AEGTS